MLGNRVVILSLVLSLFSSVYAADSYKELSRQYDLTFQQFLTKKILTLPKHVTVQLFLKDRTVVTGTFEGFSTYDDSIWITPVGKHGLFAEDAYDISELQDVRIVILRSI